MTLLERIDMINRPEWTPTSCSKCGRLNPGHTELGCPQYEKCRLCGNKGAHGFIKKHWCVPFDGGEDSWMNDVDGDYDLYWNNGDDATNI